MNHNMNKQLGMTGMGWLTVLFLIGFFALLTFKLAPIYLENYSVKGVLQSFEEEPLITQKSTKVIRRMLMARLNTNGVRDIKKEHVTIDKKRGVLKIAINYFVRKSMVGNVDIVVTFADKVELVSN
ncbi:MAG: DUF4845 domain-containing protein [Gammaproteobacteria bacterium]|nr:DUF4845 domain-containing protein [Gammaproteobacteria bacterium]